MTKLFTTYVALQYLSAQTEVTVGAERKAVSWDASVAGLRQGDRLTVEALVKCALIVSGCDASYSLAAAAGREILKDPNAAADVAVQTFMVQVNQSAALLGMVNTNFVTPDGAHADQHYISVQAFTVIAECCLENDLMASVMATYTDKVSVTAENGKSRVLTLRSTNENMNPANTACYREQTVGMKTGYTSKAGACILSAFKVEDGYLIVGVFGCKDKNDRFEDAAALFDYFT